MSSLRICLVATFAAFLGTLRMAGANIPLLDAIRADDADRVRTLLAAGGDPNAVDSNHASPLMYAALYARPQVSICCSTLEPISSTAILTG